MIKTFSKRLPPRWKEVALMVLAGVIIVSRSAILFFSSVTLQGITGKEENPSPTYLYGIAIDSLEVITRTLEPGESLGSLLVTYGVDAQSIAVIAEKARLVMPVRNIRAGNTFAVIRTTDSLPRTLYFVYENNPVSYTLFDLRDTIRVYQERKEILLLHDTVHAEIQSSLWKALSDEEHGPGLALALEDIFGWAVDFFSIQKGDRFTAFFQREVCEGKTIGIKRITSAVFQQGGKDIWAFYHQPDSSGQYDGYYDEKGQSLKRAFLKAPLRFSRISSKFSNSRFHPVLKIYRAHHGVDYAAPSGTPVFTIGDGVVISAGYHGQGGRTVKIRHNSLYTTAYLHLSRFGPGIQSGTRVKQGQVIGYVGSTGLSTGPHLDFRVYKAGRPVNPLSMESPPSHPLPARFLTSFLSKVSVEMNRLQAAADPAAPEDHWKPVN